MLLSTKRTGILLGITLISAALYTTWTCSAQSAIEQLARSYNTFQHNVGTVGDDAAYEVIDQLFAENFSKIANGAPLTTARAQLKEQLQQFRVAAGSWEIKEQFIIPSADGKHCTIRFQLISQNLGSFDVLAVLTSSDGKQIENINEIYYMMQATNVAA